MTTEDFNALFDAVVARCREIHRTKGVQYSTGHGGEPYDRLGNFKRAAARKGVEPETILSIYADKHRDTMDYVNKTIQETGRTPKLAEPLIETVADLVNYAVLNLGLTIDRDRAAEAVKAVVDESRGVPHAPARECAECRRGRHDQCGGPESGCGCAAANHFSASASDAVNEVIRS